MIVIPRVLHGLLRELDEHTASAVALDFAEQSILEGFPIDVDVAQEAQRLAGRRALARDNDHVLARAARWEAARRQLLHLITVSPSPV